MYVLLICDENWKDIDYWMQKRYYWNKDKPTRMEQLKIEEIIFKNKELNGKYFFLFKIKKGTHVKTIVALFRNVMNDCKFLITENENIIDRIW